MAGTAPKKSWARAPELHFKYPDGPIRLGNVIVQPSDPEYPIANLADLGPGIAPKLVTGEPQRNRTMLRVYSGEASADAGAWFYELVTLHAGLQKGKNLRKEYKMDFLEPVFYAALPSTKAIEELRKNESVRRAAGHSWSRTLYIVAGVQIASRLSVKEYQIQHSGGDAVLEVKISAEASAGANAKRTEDLGEADSYRIIGDVILAYKLVKVSKDWKLSDQIKKVHPKGALMSDSQTEQVEDGEGEIEAVFADEGDSGMEDLDWLE